MGRQTPGGWNQPDFQRRDQYQRYGQPLSLRPRLSLQRPGGWDQSGFQQRDQCQGYGQPYSQQGGQPAKGGTQLYQAHGHPYHNGGNGQPPQGGQGFAPGVRGQPTSLPQRKPGAGRKPKPVRDPMSGLPNEPPSPTSQDQSLASLQRRLSDIESFQKRVSELEAQRRLQNYLSTLPPCFAPPEQPPARLPSPSLTLVPEQPPQGQGQPGAGLSEQSPQAQGQSATDLPERSPAPPLEQPAEPPGQLTLENYPALPHPAAQGTGPKPPALSRRKKKKSPKKQGQPASGSDQPRPTLSGGAPGSEPVPRPPRSPLPPVKGQGDEELDASTDGV